MQRIVSAIDGVAELSSEMSELAASSSHYMDVNDEEKQNKNDNNVNNSKHFMTNYYQLKFFYVRQF